MVNQSGCRCGGDHPYFTTVTPLDGGGASRHVLKNYFRLGPILYLGPFITVTNSNSFAIKRDIDGEIQIFPVPGIAKVIFW